MPLDPELFVAVQSYRSFRRDPWAELAQEVQFVLEKIPIAYRTILVLRDLEGFSSAEVAAIVGRREATIRWRLAKARDLFREHWERRQDLTRREVKHGE